MILSTGHCLFRATPLAAYRFVALFALFSIAQASAKTDSHSGAHRQPEIRATSFDGQFQGPEGLVADRDGAYYASEEGGRGLIWRCRDRRARLFCNLPHLLGPDAGMLLGLALTRGDLFVAAPNYRGGSVIRIPLCNSGRMTPFATHLGKLPNGLISDGHVLFVSETASGRIFRLPLHRRTGSPPTAREIFSAPCSAPNGLALSPNGRTLYIIHTGLLLGGYVSSVDTASMQLHTMTPFSGMGDGLAWWRGSLWACRQREGELVRIDPQHLDRQIPFYLAGGRESGGIRPASIAFSSNPDSRGTGAVTDVAEAGTFDYLLRALGFPLRWHHGVYHFVTPLP